jgi:branched-chain amino acid transport system substrate-binding protein
MAALLLREKTAGRRRNMKCKRQKEGLFLALIVTVVFVWASFPSEAVGAGKPKTIHVAIIGDFSGPYAPVVGPARPGTEDAWEYINNKLGGVHGVKVTPVIRDMNGKMDIGQSMYNEVITLNPKPVFVDGYFGPLFAALRQRYVEDDVVGFGPGNRDSIYPVANSYGYWSQYSEQTALALKWIKDNWKEKRNPKIGILTWDTTYGKAILNEEFYAYLKKIGVDLVGTEMFGMKEVDVTVQLLRLKSKDPDFIVSCSLGAGPLAIHKGLKEMGWKVPLVNSGGQDWGTVRLDPALFEGDIIGFPTKSFDEENDPSIKTIMQLFTANKRTVNEKSLLYLVAWQCALLEQKIMIQIVDKYGWDGLTTKNIKAALDNLQGFDVMGGLQKVSYSKDRKTPTKARVYKVSNGKLLPVTPFLEVPDLKPRQ